MEFATVGLRSLLPKLTQLLQDEYNLQTSAKKGIEFLHSELEAMHAALRKVGEVPREQLDELQRIWARDVREMSYDMEDIVDAFMVRVEGPPDPHSESSAGWIFNLKYTILHKFSAKVIMARREIAQQIKDINERAKELAERRDRYKVDGIIAPTKYSQIDGIIAPANRTPVDPRLKALYTDATEIVGIEEAKKQVITILTQDQVGGQQKMMVSIAGFGGLGKTTLAKAVYDEIKKDFGCTAFVSVSRNPDTNKLLKDMLYALDKEKFEDIHSKMLDETHLIDLIREFLQNRRYLIVIDDIWDKEPWDEVIRHAMIENNMRSRIITTTRIIDVAEHVGGCYMLRPLSNESSEMLFYGRIFGSKDKCPREFSEVSEKILKKCGGVPLAIVTTSSLLANKSENIKEWFSVCESIGSGLGRNPDMDRMRKILLLSYYDLPSHLKACLLYLSIFPEDYEIRKDVLIWRWVAEGFVQQDQQAGRQSFLEIGESYFNELLNRSLIQPADMDDLEGTPKACRVHDTVLDLIISLSVQECFITTVLGDGIESKEIRRLSLHNNTAWPTMEMTKLRSLTIFKPVGAVIDPTPSLSRYHLLRVLDLRGCKLKDLGSLGFLGSLSHLRYLSLSGFRRRSGLRLFGSPDLLPLEIGKLRFLQTLDLSETTVEELPSSVIMGLGQLMCLRGCLRGCGSIFGSSGTLLPNGLKNLTSLEVLESAVVTSECVAKELGRLTQLRVLEIGVRLSAQDEYGDEWRACAKALVESLGKLSKIESLHICDERYSVNLDGSMENSLGNMRRLWIEEARSLPTWIRPASLPGLSYLDIEVVQERREDIQVLGTLPCLCHLKFRVTFEEAMERCVVGPGAFPCTVRCVFDIPAGGVVPCMFPRGVMTRLQDLKFRWSGGGATVVVDDLALGHLPSLESVTVVFDDDDENEASKDMVKSVREKLEHEAAVHPNHPLIHWRRKWQATA